MNNWLKGLVAAACLVVCAAGANYAWSSWAESRRAAEHRVAVYEFLNAKPGDDATAVATCQKVKWNLSHADDLNWNEDVTAFARKMIAVCETNNFL